MGEPYVPAAESVLTVIGATVNKHKKGSITLSSGEAKQLEKAYMCLYNLIQEFPTSLSEFFSKEDYLNIVRWSCQIQGHVFVEEYWI